MAGGVCMAGGCVHGRGMCGREDVCGGGGGMHGRGACVAGGMHGRGGMAGGHVWHAPPNRYYEIRSMSGWYASYWNTFLFTFAVDLFNQYNLN